ncbi:MAG: hypothetical protein H6603_10290 [Flavobacteriales bacterium]|nr:hypothetical protein [Flavobacteriales bacterium]MCB9205353.1 hypothetical protein [Flavobacteriales bacterium]
MGIFDKIFGRKKPDELSANQQKPSENLAKEENPDVSVTYSIAYKLVGYNTDASPWFEKDKEVIDEMVKKSDEYFSRDKVYTNAEIQRGGMALDFNVWKFAKWEQKVVSTKEVDGVVVEKKAED